MLEMAHIGKSFSGVHVLNDVHFDLKSGEVHILAGENGAGKSTLVKILAGVYPDYDGDIHVEGRSVRPRFPNEARATGVAIIYQELSLVPTMSVLDNLFLGHEPGGRLFPDRQQQRVRAGQVLQQLGLDVELSRPVGEYPLAVQQMIEISKALACDARILIMDEPTSALTDVETARLFEVIRRLKADGHAIVYITHKMDEIYRLADRITVLRDGNWIGTAPAADLPIEKLVQWMVGRELRQQFPPRVAGLREECLSVDGFSVPHPVLRGRWLVQNVSFKVRAGEILGLAGLQGSGNSELLMGLYGGYGRQTSGRVQIEGRPFAVVSPHRSIEQGMALLTNDRKTSGLVLVMSVGRNITLASLRRYSPGGWIRRRAENIGAEERCRSLGVRAHSIDQEAGRLSGGNQQKVALAKCIETRPKVLLLDEPTRGVDVGAKHEIYELMDQWTAEGAAILLITSEMPELLAMSDRIIALHRGRITAEFARHEATQEKILRAAMGEEIESDE